jgi:hypothetical protein
MSPSDYRIEARISPNVALCRDIFCPLHRLSLQVDVLGVSQHDGRSWKVEEVLGAEQALVDEIMSVLRSKVEDFVRNKAKPYHCHCFGEERERLENQDNLS